MYSSWAPKLFYRGKIMNLRDDMITLHIAGYNNRIDWRVINRRDIVEIIPEREDNYGNRTIVIAARWQHRNKIKVRETGDEILKLMDEGDSTR